MQGETFCHTETSTVRNFPPSFLAKPVWLGIAAATVRFAGRQAALVPCQLSPGERAAESRTQCPALCHAHAALLLCQRNRAREGVSERYVWVLVGVKLCSQLDWREAVA